MQKLVWTDTIVEEENPVKLKLLNSETTAGVVSRTCGTPSARNPGRILPRCGGVCHSVEIPSPTLSISSSNSLLTRSSLVNGKAFGRANPVTFNSNIPKISCFKESLEIMHLRYNWQAQRLRLLVSTDGLAFANISKRGYRLTRMAKYRV